MSTVVNVLFFATNYQVYTMCVTHSPSRKYAPRSGEHYSLVGLFSTDDVLS